MRITVAAFALAASVRIAEQLEHLRDVLDVTRRASRPTSHRSSCSSRDPAGRDRRHRRPRSPCSASRASCCAPLPKNIPDPEARRCNSPTSFASACRSTSAAIFFEIGLDRREPRALDGILVHARGEVVADLLLGGRASAHGLRRVLENAPEVALVVHAQLAVRVPAILVRRESGCSSSSRRTRRCRGPRRGRRTGPSR